MFKRFLYCSVTIAAFGTFQGCANVGSIYRPLAVEGKAVSIDGYQTPIFSSVIDISKDHRDINEKDVNRTVVCPSPPVDAIAAHSFGAAGTNVFTSPTAKDTAQFSLADVMAAASIGLRTNSTTLLSYNSAWNCLAYMGGATSDPKFMELARRNQNNTLGILAIEQLTGVIKAGQATIGGTSAGATGSDDTSALSAGLESARKDKNSALSALDQKKLAQEEALTKLNQTSKAVADARAEFAKLPASTSDDQKTEAQKRIDDAVTTQTAQMSVAKSAKLEVDSAQREVERANSSVSAAEDVLSQAQLRVKASASATAAITAQGGPQAAATKEIAAAVTTIVQAVLFESGRGEACNNLFDDLIRTPEKYKNGVAQQLFDLCLKQKNDDIQTKKDLLSRGTKPLF